MIDLTNLQCQCGEKPILQHEVFKYQAQSGKEVAVVTCIDCQMINHENDKTN